MTSKAQAAALNAIAQRIDETQRKFSELAFYYEDAGGGPVPPPRFGLDEVEELAIQCIADIRALITEYSLDQHMSTDAQTRILEALYEEAGRRKDYAWQAAFAKRHQLK
jgi:hypothetical protein